MPGYDPCYRYQFSVGTYEFSRYGLDDRQARRLLARWLRLIWPKAVAHTHAKYPGSMADSTNSGWYSAPEAQISRVWVDVVVPIEGHVTIERFDADVQGIAEFIRVYAGW